MVCCGNKKGNLYWGGEREGYFTIFVVMKSFAELIENRRSIRQFSSEPLAAEDVQALLTAALRAPSGKNRQLTQYILVEEKDKLLALSMMKEHGSQFLAGAALAIVVLGSPLQTERWQEDAAIAATYIQLQAEDLGLGSCWCHVFGSITPNGQEATQYVRNTLNIPYQQEVLCIIGVGRKGEHKEPRPESELKWENVFIGEYPDWEAAPYD